MEKILVKDHCIFLTLFKKKKK